MLAKHPTLQLRDLCVIVAPLQFVTSNSWVFAWLSLIARAKVFSLLRLLVPSNILETILDFHQQVGALEKFVRCVLALQRSTSLLTITNVSFGNCEQSVFEISESSI